MAVAYPVSLATGTAAGLAVFGAGRAVEDCGVPALGAHAGATVVLMLVIGQLRRAGL